ALPSPTELGSPDEADLSAEEAQAGADPWVPGAQPDALRPGDPEAPASEGPQAPHPLALGARGSPRLAPPPPLPERRLRSRLPRGKLARQSLPGAAFVCAGRPRAGQRSAAGIVGWAEDR